MRITKLFKKLRKLPKKYIVAIAAGLAIALPIAVHAGFGPNRPVFDWNNPADRTGSTIGPVFNSFINTPTYGDERAFVDAKEATNTSPGGFADTVSVQPGKEYTVRAYVHNNANQATNNGVGMAKNTRIKFKILPGMANGNEVTGFISADNAIDRNGNPLRTVFDTVKLKNDTQAFALQYVPGSARLESNVHPFPGVALPDAITSDNGVLIGNNQDGNLPGCFEFTEIITIKVKVVAPALQFSKKVTTPGSTNWQKSLTAKPGDTVSWLLDYKNVGTGTMNNITLRDQMPSNVTLVPGSITWIDSNHPNGEKLQDTALSSGGVDVGNYGVQGGGYIRFRTKINNNPTECVITNVAFARAENVPEQSDTATVNIENCKPKVPTFSCDLLKAEQISGNTFKFTVNASANGGAAIKSYTFNFGDNTTPLTTDQTSVQHTYAPGSYLAKVTVNVRVNGQDKTAESAACMVPVKVSVPPTTPPTPPTTTLINTGAGDVVGIFAATTVAGAVFYRLFILRRFSR